MKKLTFGLALAVCAHGGNASANAGFSSQMSVTAIHARDSSTDALVSGFNNPLGCSNPQWIRIENSVGNGDMMRATLLTAYAAGKPVTAWTTHCAPDGVTVIISVWAG